MLDYSFLFIGTYSLFMVDKKIILASKSPRRKELLEGLEIPFEIRTKEVEEIYPNDLAPLKVAPFLAELKVQPLISSLKEGEILLTSDTVVVWNNEILGKPKDENDAKEMLLKLSGTIHEVITAVHMRSLKKSVTFSNSTKVHFTEITEKEILHYIEKYKPFDKAGSYGIQEWIGFIGIKKIEGCYFSVMGLPVHDVYQQFLSF